MYGVECKRVDAPSFTQSMRIALHDLELGALGASAAAISLWGACT